MKRLNEIILLFFLSIYGVTAQGQIGINEDSLSKEILSTFKIMDKKFQERINAIERTAGDQAVIHEELRAERIYQQFLVRREFSKKRMDLLKSYRNAESIPYFILLSKNYFIDQRQNLQELYKILPERSKNSEYGKEIKQILERFDFDIDKDLTITGNADTDYQKLNNLDFLQELDRPFAFVDSDGKEISQAQIDLKREILEMKKREFGWQLWKYYPNDSRRYKWFEQTALVKGLIHYWKNIEAGNLAFYSEPGKNYSSAINWSALKAWEKAYPEMRKEYFGKFNGTKNKLIEMERKFAAAELANFIKLSTNEEYLRHKGRKKIDMRKLETLLIYATNKLSEEIASKTNPLPEMGALGFVKVRDFFYMLRALFTGKEYSFGISNNDLLNMYKKFVKHNYNYCLTELSKDQITLLNLKTEPFELKAKSLDGLEVDLSRMKGKVVLIDFWSTNCAGCIARMPAIKEIYDKYKHKGFEVISACLNYGDETERIKAIEKSVNASWPLVLVGAANKADFENSIGIQIFRKYGFTGVPQLLLLNKKGELEIYNGLLLKGDFEPVVKKLLTANF